MIKSYVDEVHLCFYIACNLLLPYVHNTDGNACIVYVQYLFQLGPFRIQNLQRTHAETLYSSTDYTFPVLFHMYTETVET
jgi:hypothetical protein